MGYCNPPIPWSELERRLSSRTAAEAVAEPLQLRPPDLRSGGTGSGRSGTEAPPRRRGRPWAELHVHSTMSFLDGASEPEELIDAAVDAGLEAIALTDHNGLYGAARFAQAAAGRGIGTVYGAEISLGLRAKIPGQIDPEAAHALVLARGVPGYRKLSAALTRAHMAGTKNRPVIELEDLAAAAEQGSGDWYVLTGCRKGLLIPHLSDPDGGLDRLRRLVSMFGRDRLVVELTRTGLPEDDERIRHLCELAARAGVRAVATNQVHYASREQFRDAQVRAAVRANSSLDEVAGWLPPAALQRIHTGAEMAGRFPAEALDAAVEIAADCAFELRAARAGLPQAPVPDGMSDAAFLRELVTAGGLRLYGTREQRPDAWALLDQELSTIEQMGFCGYFLIVYDIARFCREHDIFCQGRGSAANSAVCYVLGITAVDAVRFGLLFDRFLAPEREGYPDIDVDIESGRREEVIQYVYDHYGRDRAAQVANVITYRAKSAVRDAAAALGYDPGQQDAFSKGLERWSRLPEDDDDDDSAGGAGGQQGVPGPVIAAARGLLGTPRHLGIHSGGMILADRPIGEVVPIEPATMERRTVVQWDKDDCAHMDLVKFDLLGLGMLTALHEMVDLIAAHTGERIERARLPQEDPEVFDMLCAGDAIGVFQVESRAQMATLPRMLPRCFYDLAVQVALIRPGPIQGGSVHPYIRRRQGLENPDYLHPLTRSALEKTLGVPLFQEQLMQLAIDVAGFTGGDADQLRRAMGAKRSKERMRQLADRFHAGAAARGVDAQTSQVIFDKIAAFANYGFPESHAISFANLVYDSAWFKRYHHAAFTAGLLRAQPMGFYSAQSLIADARRHGVRILPVDVQASNAQADLEADADSTGGFAIRIGLSAVRGADSAAEVIVAAREAAGPFTSIGDLAQRTGVDVTVLESLATAGAFSCFGLDRRQALWVAGSQGGSGPGMLPGTAPVAEAPALPLMSSFDITLAELFSTGLTVDGYPTEQLRARLRERGYASTANAQQAVDGQTITVAGLVTHRQRPGTASGVTFMNLEDEFGMLNIACSPGLMRRYRPISYSHNVLVIRGRVQRAGTVVSVTADKLIPLDVTMPVKSRNFQ
ncbi:error-prone DNA polymerase [Brevibacterium luteolum]|uniref:error-prone DNA polymerase n=1 Tax=Brevibacterium luteolum TaxID=199591 RepID=UPI00387A00A3